MNNTRIIKILVINFITMVTFTMAHPVTPMLINTINLPAYMFGVLYSTMSIAQFVMSPIWGNISDDKGRKKILIIGVLGYGIGQLGFGMSTNQAMILIFRIISGALSVGFITTSIAYVSDVSTKEERIKYMSYHTATTAIASSAGSLLGGYIGLLGYKYTFIAQMILSIIVAILIYFTIDETIEKNDKKIKIYLEHLKLNKVGSQLNKNLLIMMVVMTLVTFATTSYNSTINYYVETILKLPTNINGMIMAISGVIALFMNIVVNPYVGRKFDENKSIKVITILAGVSIIVSSLSKNAYIALPAIAIFIATSSMSLPIQQSIVSKLSKNNYGEIMGIQYSYKALGMVAGSLISGFVFDYSENLPFILGGITCIIAFVLLGFRNKE